MTLLGGRNHSALRHNAPASRGEGLDATANFRPSSAQRGNISLDIPFYRTEGL